jgi:hypothetical protein
MLTGSGAYGLAVFTTLLAAATLAFYPHVIAKHHDDSSNGSG